MGIWIGRTQTLSDVWLREVGGIVEARSLCCNSKVKRVDFVATCTNCEKQLVVAEAMTQPLTQWYLNEHIAQTASVRMWIHNWTGIPEEDIGIEVDGEKK